MAMQAPSILLFETLRRGIEERDADTLVAATLRMLSCRP